MDILINDIVFSFCLGLAFAMFFVFEPYNRLMGEYLNFKPFNCVLCLTWWGSAVILYLLDINAILAFFCSFVAEFSYRKLINE